MNIYVKHAIVSFLLTTLTIGTGLIPLPTSLLTAGYALFIYGIFYALRVIMNIGETSPPARDTFTAPIIEDPNADPSVPQTGQWGSGDSASLQLEEEFFNQVMDHAQSLGYTAAVGNIDGELMIVHVDDSSNATPLVPLVVPGDGKNNKLTKENVGKAIEYMKESLNDNYNKNNREVKQ